MFIFEITIPGTWLDYEDDDWSYRIQNLLSHLQSNFFEANAALNLFMNTLSTVPRGPDREAWERDCDRRSVIRAEVGRELGDNKSNTDNFEQICLETEIRFKREKWSNGSIPRELKHPERFIYARSFLYALDLFEKFLKILSKEASVSPELIGLHKRVETEFPQLRGVRNSTQHMEDRARGLGAERTPKAMDLKPVNNQWIHAPNGGVLILDSLYGSKFGTTMADGHYGEIDVSPESMKHLQRILDEVLQLFRWKGPKMHLPSS